MKKQNTQSKVIVALTAVVLLLVALSATLTFAYFTATNNASSTAMTFGTLGLNTATATATQRGTCSAHQLVPGCSIDLNGSVDVTGNVAANMRLIVTAEVYQKSTSGTYFKLDNNNKVVEAQEGDAGAFQAIKTTSATVDSPAAEILALVNGATAPGWVKHNGYFYKDATVTGNATNPTKVAFAVNFTTSATALGNDWQGAYVQFGITVEAVQAAHLSTDYSEVTSGNVAGLAAENAWAAVSTNGVYTAPVNPEP